MYNWIDNYSSYASNGKEYVAVDFGGRVDVSKDLKNWTEIKRFTYEELSYVAYTGNQFVAFNDRLNYANSSLKDHKTNIYVSENGIDWTEKWISLPEDVSNWHQFSFMEDEFENYLKNSKQDHIELTFAQIEGVLGDKLSPSAYNHIAYWHLSETHTFPHAWLNAGYKMDKSTKNLPSFMKGRFPCFSSGYLRQPGYHNVSQHFRPCSFASPAFAGFALLRLFNYC